MGLTALRRHREAREGADQTAVEVEGVEPGEAVNEETGEVTPPGEPLPEVAPATPRRRKTAQG